MTVETGGHLKDGRYSPTLSEMVAGLRPAYKSSVYKEQSAAGSGKTEALVLDQLRHTKDPNFESVTFRRNTKSLKGAGGIFNKAGKVYKRLGAEQRMVDLMYRWPSGATSRYSHLEHNERTAEEDHQGLE